MPDSELEHSKRVSMLKSVYTKLNTDTGKAIFTGEERSMIIIALTDYMVDKMENENNEN
jgi:hypothetical protein